MWNRVTKSLMSLWISIKKFFNPTNKANRPNECETWLRALLDNTGCGIIATNTDGKVLLFNQEAEKLFGYSEQEMKQEGLDVLVPPAYRGKTKKLFLHYLQAGINGLGEIREVEGIHKDGSKVGILLKVRVVDYQDEVLFVGTACRIEEIVSYFQQVTCASSYSQVGFCKAIEADHFHQSLQDLAEIAVALEKHFR